MLTEAEKNLPQKAQGCPFCWSTPIMKVGHNLKQKPVSYTIYCPKCKIEFFSSKSARYVVKKWNSRCFSIGDEGRALDYVART